MKFKKIFWSKVRFSCLSISLVVLEKDILWNGYLLHNSYWKLQYRGALSNKYLYKTVIPHGIAGNKLTKKSWTLERHSSFPQIFPESTIDKLYLGFVSHIYSFSRDLDLWWTRVDLCQTHVDSCWPVLYSCWLVLGSCWFVLSFVGLVLTCVDTGVLEYTWSYNLSVL